MAFNRIIEENSLKLSKDKPIPYQKHSKEIRLEKSKHSKVKTLTTQNKERTEGYKKKTKTS